MLFSPYLSLALLPVAFAAVHEVQVGAGGQLLFSPEAIVSTNQSLDGIGF